MPDTRGQSQFDNENNEDKNVQDYGSEALHSSRSNFPSCSNDDSSSFTGIVRNMHDIRSAESRDQFLKDKDVDSFESSEDYPYTNSREDSSKSSYSSENEDHLDMHKEKSISRAPSADCGFVAQLNIQDYSPTIQPLLPCEVEELQEKLRSLGMRTFFSEVIRKGGYSLPKLIYVFKEQFEHDEWHEITQKILVSKQLPEIYACVHIALDRFLMRRKKLTEITTFDNVVQLFRTRKHILVITGAGISVSCGIPDFRSKNGIYARLTDFELEDPTQMFDIEYFRRKPETFFSFAKEIYTSNFKPSPSHYFVAMLEKKHQLLRNYTQNIDNLEEVAGIHHLIQCHGSFRRATCMTCGYSVPGKHIEGDIMNSTVPKCPTCPSTSSFPVLKPDIVFFGEALPSEFHESVYLDLVQTDFVVVIGSSLKVAPVSEILKSVPENVPQVLINNERLSHLQNHFDVELIGASDTIIRALSVALGWENGDPPLFRTVAANIHLFDGHLTQCTSHNSSASTSNSLLNPCTISNSMPNGKHLIKSSKDDIFNKSNDDNKKKKAKV